MPLTKTITRSIRVYHSARVKQLIGLFDLPPQAESRLSWKVELELPEEWNIGVIVGPSGAGKTTVARELFGERIAGAWPWPEDRSVLDGFPAGMSIKEITALLSSVGFSSPPAWVRPFGVLSNGQQFRVHLARTLAEMPTLTVVDEFTSVVDRTVARIGSAAIARTVRRRKQQFVAVTCHYDVLDWMDPDWVYEPHTGKLTRGWLRRRAQAQRENAPRRPAIELEISRCDRRVWPLFKPHHYLSGDLHRSAACFLACCESQPAAFTAVLPFPHPTRPGWREHRTVCLSDFQGVGIGHAMSEFVAGLYAATGRPYTSTTSHPAMIGHRARSPLWRMTRKPGLIGAGRRGGLLAATSSCERLTASFVYVGPTNAAEARRFGISIHT